MRNVNRELRNVEQKQTELSKKEEKLEEKVKKDKKDSWGEKAGEDHMISMKPLTPHFSNPFGSDFKFENLQEKMNNIGERIHKHM